MALKQVVISMAGGLPLGFRLSSHQTDPSLFCVSKVRQHSKAERAGLEQGDVILAVNGICCESLSHLAVTALTDISELLEIRTLRNMKNPSEAKEAFSNMGVSVRRLTDKEISNLTCNPNLIVARRQSTGCIQSVYPRDNKQNHFNLFAGGKFQQSTINKMPTSYQKESKHVEETKTINSSFTSEVNTQNGDVQTLPRKRASRVKIATEKRHMIPNRFKNIAQVSDMKDVEEEMKKEMNLQRFEETANLRRTCYNEAQSTDTQQYEEVSEINESWQTEEARFQTKIDVNLLRKELLTASVSQPDQKISVRRFSLSIPNQQVVQQKTNAIFIKPQKHQTNNNISNQLSSPQTNQNLSAHIPNQREEQSNMSQSKPIFDSHQQPKIHPETSAKTTLNPSTSSPNLKISNNEGDILKPNNLVQKETKVVPKELNRSPRSSNQLNIQPSKPKLIHPTRLRSNSLSVMSSTRLLPLKVNINSGIRNPSNDLQNVFNRKVDSFDQLNNSEKVENKKRINCNTNQIEDLSKRQNINVIPTLSTHHKDVTKQFTPTHKKPIIMSRKMSVPDNRTLEKTKQNIIMMTKSRGNSGNNSNGTSHNQDFQSADKNYLHENITSNNYFPHNYTAINPQDSNGLIKSSHHSNNSDSQQLNRLTTPQSSQPCNLISQQNIEGKQNFRQEVSEPYELPFYDAVDFFQNTDIKTKPGAINNPKINTPNSMNCNNNATNNIVPGNNAANNNMMNSNSRVNENSNLQPKNIASLNRINNNTLQQQRSLQYQNQQQLQQFQHHFQSQQQFPQQYQQFSQQQFYQQPPMQFQQQQQQQQKLQQINQLQNQPTQLTQQFQQPQNIQHSQFQQIQSQQNQHLQKQQLHQQQLHQHQLQQPHQQVTQQQTQPIRYQPNQTQANQLHQNQQNQTNQLPTQPSQQQTHFKHLEAQNYQNHLQQQYHQHQQQQYQQQQQYHQQQYHHQQQQNYLKQSSHQSHSFPSQITSTNYLNQTHSSLPPHSPASQATLNSSNLQNSYTNIPINRRNHSTPPNHHQRVNLQEYTNSPPVHLSRPHSAVPPTAGLNNQQGINRQLPSSASMPQQHFTHANNRIEQQNQYNNLPITANHFFQQNYNAIPAPVTSFNLNNYQYPHSYQNNIAPNHTTDIYNNYSSSPASYNNNNNTHSTNHFNNISSSNFHPNQRQNYSHPSYHPFTNLNNTTSDAYLNYNKTN